MKPYEPVIYTPVYNDAEALEKSAEKMKGLGLRRIVIDGRFEGFDKIGNSDVSTDNVKEVCEKYGFEYMICTPCLEQHKFNFACQVLSSRGHKVMILLACDEYLTMMKPTVRVWLERFCSGCEYPMMLNIQIEELRPGHKYDQKTPFLPKVFYNLDKLENRNNHWATYVKGTYKLLRAYDNIVPTVILHHDNTFRSEERDELMLEYQDRNIEKERGTQAVVSRDRFYG